MPLQTPQWTEVLSCPICCKDFSPAGRQPVSLSCGHTVCRMCLSKLHRQQCPFDQTAISKNVDKLPTNYAILQLVVGPEVMLDPSRDRIPDGMKPADFEIYHSTQLVIEELALYLKPLNKSSNGSLGSSQSGSLNSSSGSGGNQLLSRPIQRKLVTLVNCQLVEEEGRARAVRAARSLGERVVTELIIQHQNPQQLSTNLWAAVRARGCQFLGPAMQEETLKLVLLALEDGTPLSRKVLVMFVVQKLEQQFPQASKTSVGHVVQLLYRASCFKVTKREEESSLMQLKEEFRNYESLRREHDAQIVQIAIEAGLRISPEQWSSLLYGDLNHKSHMQSIIDKLQTPASFTSSIQELTICLQRSGDPVRLAQLHGHLEKLAAIDPSPGAMSSSWEKIKSAVDAVKKVLQGLMDFMQNYSQNKKALDLQTQNIKYKTSLCRDVQQKGGCPRGPSCTFAHSEEELERYRSKSRQLLSMLNNQAKNQKNLRAEDKLLHQQIMDGSIDLSAILGDNTLSWPESETRPLSARGVPPANSERLLSHGSGVRHSENGMVQRPSPEGESQEEDIPSAPDLDEKLQSLLGLQETLAIGDMPPRGGRGKELPDLAPQSRSHQSPVSASSRSTATPNAQLYLANRSMSRNDSEPSYNERESSVGGGGGGLGGGGRVPPSHQQQQQQLEHHRDWLLAARDVPQSEGRYGVRQEDDYYYERRLAGGYRPPPSESPLAYKTPSDPAPPLQPRILIPTNPPPPPPSAPDRYLDQKAPQKHGYPYIQPLGGRYHYPDQQAPLPPSRPTVYRRPAVQRYVDPHTLKAYDVVPAEDYPEQSAPPVPGALVPSHEYHLQQRQMQEESRYRDHVELHRNYYPPSRVAPNMPPAPPIGTVLIPSARDLQDEPVAPVAHMRKEVKTPPVIAPPHPSHPTKIERGPSLTELKERQDYLKTMLDGMQEGKTKDWKAVSKPSSSWPSAPQMASENDYSMSKSSSLTRTSSIWTTSPTTSTIPTSSSLQFHGVDDADDDDEDDDHDHRNNGIDVDDEDDLLSKPVRDDDDDEEDDDGENLNGHDGRTNGGCSSSGSYNPWTSTPLFTPNTGKAKETSTNYTMTYSKVLVRHMSANENEEGSEQVRHMGTHGMHDFEAMSMGDLKRTLNEVKQQDKRAGSSHHERTSKIQMEMVRRNDDTAPGEPPTTSLSTTCHHATHQESSPISNTNIVPLPAQLVTKKPILHLYTKYAQEVPPVPRQRGRGGIRIYEPASRTARSMGRNTVPLKVSAGMVDNTMPVNMTVQDCQVAPGFQNPDREGYYIRTAEGRGTDPLDSCSSQPQDDWESKVDELVECDPKAKQVLKQALNKVSTQIQVQETRKDAHNTFILNFEEQALGNLVSTGDPRMHEHGHGQTQAGDPRMHEHARGLTQAPRAEPHMQMPVSAYNPTPQLDSRPQPGSRAIEMQENVLSRYSRQASLPQAGAQPPHPYPSESPFNSAWSMGSGGSSISSGASMPPTRGGGGGGSGGGGGGGSWPQDYPPAGAAYHQPSRQWAEVTPDRRMVPPEPHMGRAYTMPAGRTGQMTKEEMELNDQRIAREMQRVYQEENLQHMQTVQQRHEHRMMQEHYRRQQEERDRKTAQDLAMRDAMDRGYTYQ